MGACRDFTNFIRINIMCTSGRMSMASGEHPKSAMPTKTKMMVIKLVIHGRTKTGLITAGRSYCTI